MADEQTHNINSHRFLDALLGFHRNKENAYAAMEVLTGPKKLILAPGVTHFEIYINEAFEISSNAAAAWFREHLGLEPKTEKAGAANR